MEQVQQNESILYLQDNVQHLSQAQAKLQSTLNEHKKSKNMNNKERLRKIRDHSFLNEISLHEKRINSGASTRMHSMSQIQISTVQSFRSIKQKLKKQQQQKHSITRQRLIETWQQQELGHTTFRIIRESSEYLHSYVFGKEKKQEEVATKVNRKKADGL